MHKYILTYILLIFFKFSAVGQERIDWSYVTGTWKAASINYSLFHDTSINEEIIIIKNNKTFEWKHQVRIPNCDCIDSNIFWATQGYWGKLKGDQSLDFLHLKSYAKTCNYFEKNQQYNLENVSKDKMTMRFFDPYIKGYRVLDLIRINDEEFIDPEMFSTSSEGGLSLRLHIRNNKSPERLKTIPQGAYVRIKLKPDSVTSDDITMITQKTYSGLYYKIKNDSLELDLLDESLKVSNPGSHDNLRTESILYDNQGYAPHVVIQASNVGMVTYELSKNIKLRKAAKVARVLGLLTMAIAAPALAIDFTANTFDKNKYMAVAGAGAGLVVVSIPFSLLPKYKSFKINKDNPSSRYWTLCEK